MGAENYERLNISYGSYYFSGDSLIMKDLYSGIEIRMIKVNSKKDDEFVVLSGFNFLLGKRVLWYEDFIADLSMKKLENSLSEFIDKSRIERDSFMRSKNVLEFKVGNYRIVYEDSADNNNNRMLGFEIRLYSNNRFAYYYKEILLLEGEWEIRGNVIGLINKENKSRYYLIGFGNRHEFKGNLMFPLLHVCYFKKV